MVANMARALAFGALIAIAAIGVLATHVEEKYAGAFDPSFGLPFDGAR
ncbi:hypothetical protein [Bradyrhizobium canariense]|nr:hypothetical protein [Bradyrhizobium canariense]